MMSMRAFARVAVLAALGMSGFYSASVKAADTTPPTKPTGLGATAVSSSQINLTWTASTDTGGSGLSGYKIERCQGSSCTSYSQIATATTTMYSDTGRAASTTYRYRVRAYDGAGNNSSYSSVKNATTQAPPDTQAPTTPTGLSATIVSESRIELSWGSSTDNVGVTEYLVERCEGVSCGAYAQFSSLSGTTLLDIDLSPSTSYSYRVRATDAAGNISGYSNIETAVTPAPPDFDPPTEPAAVSAAAVSSVRVDISWTAATDNVGVTNYLVERCPGTGCSSFAQVGTAAASPYSDSGLAAATAYSYRIRAADAAGNIGGYSGTASAFTWPSGNGVSYRYDAQGRLTSTIDSAGTVVQYTYDAAGHVTGIQSTP